MINNKIHKEYLALKINYCRRQLGELPEIRLQKHSVNGKTVFRIVTADHRYILDTPKGQEYYSQWVKRDQLERELQLYETAWHCNYPCDPSPE